MYKNNRYFDKLKINLKHSQKGRSQEVTKISMTNLKVLFTFIFNKEE